LGEVYDGITVCRNPEYQTTISSPTILNLKKMAIVKNGIISGKVGNLIGYNNNGVQAFRAMPKKSNRPPTLVQLAQRMRFGTMVHFLAPLKHLTSKGYGNPKATRSQSAQCVGYNFKHAIKGTFPDMEIDYSEIVITTGKLCPVAHGEAFSDRGGCINFSWVESTRSGMHGATDNAIPVVFNPSKNRYEFIRTTSDRASQCAVLNIPLEFSGDTLHCWLIFISPNGKEFSTSCYLGTVTVA
jgi:hypothetical protein